MNSCFRHHAFLSLFFLFLAGKPYLMSQPKRMKYFFLLLFSISLSTAYSQQDKNINTNDLIMDCLKQGGEFPDNQMVVWYPLQLWELFGKQMNGSEQVMKIITEELSQYMVFAIVDYHQSISGMSFKSEDEIRKTILLYDSAGKGIPPMEMDQLSEMASELINGIKPMLGKMMGQFGEGMRLIFFDADKIKGVSLSDLSGHGSFTLAWGQARFTWQLPFASFLAPKKCPTDGEAMKGTWKYCPVHGVKLE
jgi:hypothetical protein